MTTQIDTGTEHLSIDVTSEGRLVTARIDNPESGNALSEPVTKGLFETIAALEGSDARVFVIRGAGGTFCSGGDLDTMTGLEGPMEHRAQLSTLARLATKLLEAGALTVAAVEGYCLAGGFGLASACDLLYASDGATFGLPEVTVGLFPMQAMAPITRSIPPKIALHLMFTGEFIDAATAEQFGIASSVFPEASFDEELEDVLDDLLAASPVATELGKEAFYSQRDMPYREALGYLRELFALQAMTDDAAEGIMAFMEDREPDWQGQ